MDTASICISFIVAIFGIAYPILLQVISKLDERYSSIIILELFNKEKVRKFFHFSLILSLSSILIYILKLPNPFDFGKLNLLINNSALIFLVTSTGTLVISFLYFVDKILIYYTPSQFLKYLIKQHNNSSNNNYTNFKAISDILIFSIKEQNETIANTISDFMYLAFKNYREKNEGQPVEYPSCYYEVVYKATEELASFKNKKLVFLEYKTVGGTWLLGELGTHKISETTYYWLWRNLLLAMKYERDDLIIYFWENANSYVFYQLGEIYAEYSSDHQFTIINNKEIEEINKDKERFLEFHYALGGLLLYKKRYSCINRIFNYTMSIPPKYELLPETMGEIFKRFIEFMDTHERKYTSISSNYSFPDMEGLNADYSVKNWIIRYIGVLFIRQYSIQPHLITMKPLELPNLPKTQSEKRIWLNNIDHFKFIIKDTLRNKGLLKTTKLDFISDDWLKKHEKPKPNDLLELYKNQIEQDFEKIKIEQKISGIKQQQFEESSKQIIIKAIELYNPIINPSLFTKDFNNWFIYGVRTVMDKTAFVDDQETSYLNYDSILAEKVSSNFMLGISETFFYTKSNSYLLKGNEIFQAIDKMNIDDNYIIINFRQNIDWYKNYYKVEGLNQNSYKGIEIFNCSVSNYELVGQSFFILKKSDLPNILYLDIDDKEIQKYSLKLIDENFKIYSSIIDLNSENEILEELISSHSDKELRKYVLINLLIKTEIRWKKNVKSIMLKLFSEHRDRGLPNRKKDINKLK
ncbi:MAG: hypothetical protein GF329_08625 [Candidatus Lokiarchaeota archaeon]|nr:hypothetical protein [Candidatus Lokiarchaeota archaeon]MBD3339721.1 hypothetical protein [Candidatus Lokiarchaeota archaeon]